MCFTYCSLPPLTVPNVFKHLFTGLSNRYHDLNLEHLYSSQKKACSYEESLPIPRPAALGPHLPCFCLYKFAILDISHTRDHVTHGLLCLTFYTSHVFRVCLCRSVCTSVTHSFLLTINIPLYGYTMFYLSVH